MVDPTALSWSLQDWQWDPFALKAVPCEKGKPQCTGTPAPEPAPSLDLGSASTQLVEEAIQVAGKGKGRPQCQVEGCSGNLTSLKEYHQRYKICEYHLKARPALVAEEVEWCWSKRVGCCCCCTRVCPAL